MSATIVAQQAINGIVLGSLYVLVALGLTLIYGVLVQINFAHADFVTLGAFAAYFFMHLLGGNYLASIVVALVVGASGARGCPPYGPMRTEHANSTSAHSRTGPTWSPCSGSCPS